MAEDERALARAQALADGIKVDAVRMTADIAMTDGSILTEAVIFALTDHMPRAEARPLVDIVREQSDLPLDWAALGNPAHYLGSADRLIGQAVAAARGSGQ